jgi:hypothetical protein
MTGMTGTTGPTGVTGVTGPTGPTGPTGRFNMAQGYVSVTFAANTGIQVLEQDTGISTTTYPIAGVSGYSQTGASINQIVYISEAYLKQDSGTWRGKLSGDNRSDPSVAITYNLYYFYKQ